MNRKFAGTILIILFAALMFSCEESDDGTLNHDIHLIFDVTPNIGSVGSEIIINGTHFRPIPEENIVIFNGGAEAEVKSSSTSRLQVVVPKGAITGKISITIDGITSKSAEVFEIQ